MNEKKNTKQHKKAGKTAPDHNSSFTIHHSPLVPRLRFPEFRDAGAWEVKRLGDYLVGKPEYGVNAPAVPFQENLPAYLRITDISEEGKLLETNRVSVDLHAKREQYLSDGDIVLARTGASVGKSYKYRAKDGKLVFAGFLIRIKPNPAKLNSEFLFQYLYTDPYWRWVEFSSARSGQPGINGAEYASMLLPIPPKIPEQQKIADCLSSLDELIELEARQCEALKQHKKGLMQQLFPNDELLMMNGERNKSIHHSPFTTHNYPKLRFPEFRDAGPWEIAPLIKIARRRTERNRNGAITRVLTNSAEFGVVDQREYFDKDIAIQGNLENYFIVDEGDYVYNPRISAFAPVGPISKNNIAMGVMSPLYTVFRFRKPDNEFYMHYFKSSAWHSYMRQVGSTGARHDRMAISNNDFMAMPLPVPLPKEQQKIADCLSSLDELIELQSQKVEALRQHKKGLMQQMFPNDE